MGSREETVALTQEGTLAFRRFALEVVIGADTGARAVSDKDELVVGTAEGSGLLLTDPTVSRCHCSVAATKEGFLLRDLGSKNGTSLGGFKIQGAFLEPNATFKVGKTTIRFDALADRVNEPLSTNMKIGGLIGMSPAMRRIFAVLARVAPSDATVLVEGPTGSGKELVAEALHEASPRANGPLVIVDCGAIPATLIESELFGHEKGAFTGAQTARVGALEAAHQGTVLLDEIGELPLEMQPKLLRFLEEKTIKRIGSTKAIPLDVRVVAATNRDLRAEVNRGQFRSDLYYRLDVVKLRIPPLRERREDIPLLVAHFYEQMTGTKPPADLVSSFVDREWPGNVRELRSAVERAILLGETTPEEVPIEVDAAGGFVFDPTVPFRAAKERLVRGWERRYVAEVLRRYGSLSKAAREVKMDRHHLGELARLHGLTPGKEKA